MYFCNNLYNFFFLTIFRFYLFMTVNWETLDMIFCIFRVELRHSLLNQRMRSRFQKICLVAMGRPDLEHVQTIHVSDFVSPLMIRRIQHIGNNTWSAFDGFRVIVDIKWWRRGTHKVHMNSSSLIFGIRWWSCGKCERCRYAFWNEILHRCRYTFSSEIFHRCSRAWESESVFFQVVR